MKFLPPHSEASVSRTRGVSRFANLPDVILENGSSKTGIVDDQLGVIHGEWGNILANDIGYRDFGNEYFSLYPISRCLLQNTPFVI